MMKLLDTLHRWTGGLIGLVLALLGLSGTILLYEHLWIGLPGTGDPLRGDLPTVAATRASFCCAGQVAMKAMKAASEPPGSSVQAG